LVRFRVRGLGLGIYIDIVRVRGLRPDPEVEEVVAGSGGNPADEY
jgi:hypothetical protein